MNTLRDKLTVLRPMAIAGAETPIRATQARNMGRISDKSLDGLYAVFTAWQMASPYDATSFGAFCEIYSLGRGSR